MHFSPSLSTLYFLYSTKVVELRQKHGLYVNVIMFSILELVLAGDPHESRSSFTHFLCIFWDPFWQDMFGHWDPQVLSDRTYSETGMCSAVFFFLSGNIISSAWNVNLIYVVKVSWKKDLFLWKSTPSVRKTLSIWCCIPLRRPEQRGGVQVTVRCWELPSGCAMWVTGNQVFALSTVASQAY